MLFWIGLVAVFWSVGGLGGVLAAFGLTLMIFGMLTSSSQNINKQEKQLMLMIIAVVFLFLFLDITGVLGHVRDLANDIIYGG